MLTIEEKIARSEHFAKLCGQAEIPEWQEECEQLVAWLRELQERRKAPEIITCGECKHKKDHHYEDPGEKPYIKSTCENKYGLVKDYQVHDWDFCSRAERKTDG